jgi:hypothetical protein
MFTIAVGKRRKAVFGIILVSKILILIVYFGASKPNYSLNSINQKKKDSVTNPNDKIANRFDADHWVFNFGVSQFSSIISGDRDKVITIESLVFFDHSNDYNNLKKNIRCYTKTDDETMLLAPVELLRIELMHISSFPKSLWRVKCELKQTEHKNQFQVLEVAILDSSKYDDFLKKFKESKHLVWLQKPRYFNTSIPKRKAVSNCVHMVNHIDELRFSRIQNWLELQRSIGYEKIKFYFYNVNQKYHELFHLKFNDGFVEIIEYNTSLEHLCHWPKNLLGDDPSSELYQYLYKNCLQAHEKHFKMSDGMIYNSHERMNSNDCLLKFKYEYEYITNYDIDEIIFPRLSGTNDYQNLLKVSFKINDYIYMMTGKFNS